MSQGWLAVASEEHVLRGRQGGFMQVCNGKGAPLRRIHPGDRVVYYSPTATFQGKDTLQAFTALGIVKTGEPYLFDMGGGFIPFRRDVNWVEATRAHIRPLLDVLDFSAGVRNWGYRLRGGLIPLSEHDLALISSAMGVLTQGRVSAFSASAWTEKTARSCSVR
ncbi:EVE domain-containing protein [Corallococcus sp. H22C18031201]|nr:EVE domain-containing protein [Corallococcus sp. H22C18031201]